MAPHQGESMGYWGKPTSTVDWCEENYAVNFYVAEFWNTVTNASMLLPAVWGVWDCVRDGFEKRFLLLYFFLFATGVGSLCFHATLLYSMQLMDEVPMIWGMSFVVFCLWQVDAPKGQYNLLPGLVMLSFASGVTIAYLFAAKPILFQSAYGFLVFLLLAFNLKLSLRENSRMGYITVIVPFALFFLATALWLIDQHFCTELRLLRLMTKRLSPLTQLHAWWHLLAGYATYLHIQFCLRQRALTVQYECQFKTGWWYGVRLRRKTKEH